MAERDGETAQATEHPRRCTWTSPSGRRCPACWVRKEPEQAEQRRCHAHVESLRERQCTAVRADGRRCRSAWSESRERQAEQRRCAAHVIPEMGPKKRRRRR